MEGSPPALRHHKRPHQPTVRPEFCPGALVEMLCEDAEWHGGVITRREPCFTQAERRQGAAAEGSAKGGGTEVRQLQAQEALTVVAQDDSGVENVLLWKPPEGEARTNAAIPQALWGSRVRIRRKSPLRPGGAAQTQIPTLGEICHDEMATLRAMSSFARAEPVLENTNENTDDCTMPAHDRDAFTQRFLAGSDDGDRAAIRDPGLTSLLSQMPQRRIVQEIFEAAGVPEEDRQSVKLCEAIHVAANVLAVDFQCWGNEAKRDAAVREEGSDITSDVEAAASILGCDQSTTDPIATFRAIPAHSIKVFLLPSCGLATTRTCISLGGSITSSQCASRSWASRSRRKMCWPWRMASPPCQWSARSTAPRCCRRTPT